MAKMNRAQTAAVAARIAQLPETAPLDFYSKPGTTAHDFEMYPPLRYDGTADYFFFSCLHNYGFWLGDALGYKEPLYGTWYGEKIKGSELLSKMLAKALSKNPGLFSPERLAELSEEEFARIFSDDYGPAPIFDHRDRYRRTIEYAEWFLAAKTSPQEIVDDANDSDLPLKSFIGAVREIPGFGNDRFKKREMLLAMSLAARPERILKVTDPENWRPIVDYHVMRVALRLGIVELDKTEKDENVRRRWIGIRTEHAIRSATYEANLDIIRLSGKPMSEVDVRLWQARKYCPEMTAPKCASCALADVCKMRTELFQPVFRTTSY